MSVFGFREGTPSVTSVQLLLSYVADLELEVDRLRKQAQLLHHEMRGTLKRIHSLCVEGKAAGQDQSPGLPEIDQATRHMAAVLHDLQESPGYHPAHDQVVAIAVRPLIEQVFRWQLRLAGEPKVALRLELGSEHVEWFPARLRHILDNLIACSVKHRDPAKAEAWVQLALRVEPGSYEFRICDNGCGVPLQNRDELFELFYRATPTRAAGIGVGLVVVKLLVEQSGGTLQVEGGKSEGSTFIIVLPRYDVADYLS